MKHLVFSIIIPVKEINDYIRKETIPALLKQDFKSFEIIVLPDKPSKEKFAKTLIIPTFPKTGPADKRDLGASKAKGKILAFLDDDSYPVSGWLKKAKTVFEESDRIAAVCGPTLTPPHNNIKQKASGFVWSTWLGSGGAGTYRCDIGKRREVDDYPSVNLLVTKKDFLKVGGFNCRWWPGEDTKLCLDLTQKLGKKIIYEPKVLVYHHRREILKPHLRQISRYAIHRGHFAKVLPKTSLRFGYLLPTFFTLGLFIGPLLIVASYLIHWLVLFKVLVLIYLFFVFFYLGMLFATGLKVVKQEKNIKLSFLTMTAIFITHIVYGILFVRGFLASSLTKN
jgi:cellulose synthase/poly-beta-1,6-N-acetylglucosamine synthase-like glycosyltransferase